MQPDYPPFVPMMSASVQFDYGGRTVGVMSGVDEAEAQQIVDWLAQRLPQSRM